MSATVTATTIVGVTMAVKETVYAGISDPFNVTLPDGSTPTAFSSGTGAKQLSKYAVAAGRALSASTPVTDDLTALSGTTYRNNATDFTTGVKVFYVRNNEALGSGRNLIFSGGATNPWLAKLGGTTPTRTIGPQESMLVEDYTAGGIAVSGTAKSFKLDPGANPVNVTILVAG